MNGHSNGAAVAVTDTVNGESKTEPKDTHDAKNGFEKRDLYLKI